MEVLESLTTGLLQGKGGQLGRWGWGGRGERKAGQGRKEGVERKEDWVDPRTVLAEVWHTKGTTPAQCRPSDPQ